MIFVRAVKKYSNSAQAILNPFNDCISEKKTQMILLKDRLLPLLTPTNQGKKSRASKNPHLK
jgi:hypothetical protein